MWRDWHRLSKVDTGIFTGEADCVDAFSAYGSKETGAIPMTTNGTDLVGAAVGGGAYPATSAVGNSATHAYRLVKHEVQPTEFSYEQATITSLNVTAHGITLYDFFHTSFYNTYIPYQYGGYNIRTPDDPGALMITFCLFNFGERKSILPSTSEPCRWENSCGLSATEDRIFDRNTQMLVSCY
jgi:hypothetical protein